MMHAERIPLVELTGAHRDEGARRLRMDWETERTAWRSWGVRDAGGRVAVAWAGAIQLGCDDE